MNAKFLIAAALVGVAYLIWHRHQAHVEAAAIAAITDNRGFIELAPPSGASTKEVLIVAAQNCPHEGAQRADSLAREMAERNISYRRSSSVSFDVPPDVDEKFLETFSKQHNAIMSREVPLVFVNGRVKSNPDLDEVVAEYELANR
jgi:hypothetical protein